MSGTFDETIPQENYKDILDDDKFDMDQEMEAEIGGRIIHDIQKILPNARADLRYENVGTYKRINNNEFEYTIRYEFRVQSEDLFANYTKIRDVFKEDFIEIEDYINTHSDAFRSPDHYSGFTYIQFKVLEPPLVNATKQNIQARTAERVLVGNPRLPLNVIGEITGYIGKKLPENSTRRIRPLAEPLTNAAIKRAAVAAATPATVAAKKKPWYKFWGGRSRKIRRRSKRRTQAAKRR